MNKKISRANKIKIVELLILSFLFVFYLADLINGSIFFSIYFAFLFGIWFGRFENKKEVKKKDE